MRLLLWPANVQSGLPMMWYLIRLIEVATNAKRGCEHPCPDLTAARIITWQLIDQRIHLWIGIYLSAQSHGTLVCPCVLCVNGFSKASFHPHYSCLMVGNDGRNHQ